MNPNAYNHHKAVSPVETHFRDATCLEVDCANWREGWDLIVPDPSEQSEFIRGGKLNPVRRYLESKTDPGMVTFRFYPEQKCFKQHQINLERSPFYLKNTTPMRGDDWIDDLSEGLYKRERLRQKG